jgi:hypoxanthine phosphoribosyltransferase
LSNIPALIPEDRLRQRVAELAAAIDRDYEGKTLTAVCTLGGSAMFFADVMRQVRVPAVHLFLGFASYPGRAGASGEVRITHDLAEPIEGRDVLLFEGAIVSGRTPAFVIEWLRLRCPSSLRLCTLLVKPGSLKTRLQIDYTGFEIEDRFMAVGYGIGHEPGERGLGYIGYHPMSTGQVGAPSR